VTFQDHEEKNEKKLAFKELKTVISHIKEDFIFLMFRIKSDNTKQRVGLLRFLGFDLRKINTKQ
jgi:hypothetical protein